jgi:hypothetical protein
MSCSSNLSNLGKAAVEYEVSKGMLPASRAFPSASPPYSKPPAWNTNTNYVSWVHAMLPNLDRSDLHELVTGTVQSGGLVADVGTGSLPTPDDNVAIAVLKCPSDTTDFDEERDILSYMCNSGRADFLAGPAQSPPMPFDYAANGVFDNRIKGSADTVPTPPKTSIGDISRGDGVANTILFTENVNALNWRECPTEFHVGVVWRNWVNDPPAWVVNQDLPFATFAPDLEHARPSSGHPGGVMMCFADTSVRWVNESVDYTVYARLMTSHGSRYQEPTGLPSPQVPAVLAVQSTPLGESDY